MTDCDRELAALRTIVEILRPMERARAARILAASALMVHHDEVALELLECAQRLEAEEVRKERAEAERERA